MDSDVSAEGDVENESPRNRSRISSNSDQPSSPDVNTSSSDGESSPPPAKPAGSSSGESSPAAKRVSSRESSPDIKAASSDHESSPDAKNSDTEKESSPDLKDGDGSERESSPDKDSAESDRESSPDVENKDASDRESSPEAKARASDRESSPETGNANGSDRESSPEPKARSGRESSPEPTTRELSAGRTRESDRESSPELRARESDRDSSPERGTRGSDRDSSPERGTRGSDRDSSPEPKTLGSDRYSSPERRTRDSDGESSPEPKTRGSDRDSSPEPMTHGSDRGFSPDMKNIYYNQKSSPESVKNQIGSPDITRSPENGVWPNSPENRSPVKLRSRSSSLDGEQLKERRRTSSDRIYENTNGNISPKRSGSVYSGSRSDLASSLDSVSPSQFEQHGPKGEFDDDEAKNDEKISDSKKAMIGFADDLSDVSDIESNDSFDGQQEPVPERVETEVKEEDEVVNTETNDDKQEDAVSLHVDGEEQLDFEAEEGECSPKAENKKIAPEEESKPEKVHSDLEEGELSDDNDAKPEETERPVCRFFSRGHCTWGSNCRFIHPGVMDKGNYSMFDTVRPIVTPGGPPPANATAPMMYPAFPPHIIPPHLTPDRGGLMPPGGPIRKDETPTESAWERGLRQAKEMIRKSSKRKETEVDFEDKKMNLTLSQDEIDKENDYYSRHSGSPPVKSPDLADKWKMEAEAKSHRSDTYPNDLPVPAPHANSDVPPLGYYPPLHHGISRPDYWNPHRMGGLPYEDYALRSPHIPYGPDYYSAAAGRRYMHPNSYYPPRPGGVPPPPSHHPDFYDRKQKHKPYPGSSREVIVQKNDKPYKDERYRGRREESPRVDRARGDDWADPWMRTKSPASGRRRRRGKNTYSSGSSYSSSSESGRSSSRSSVSSRSRPSRSRSKARSSGSRSHSSSRSASARRKPPMQFKLSPSSRQQLPVPKKNPKAISPTLLLERRAATERALHMNPPPPSPKIKQRPHSPPQTAVIAQPSPSRAKLGLPERLLAHSKAAAQVAMRSNRSSESRSSKSSSGSSSSDSSSDSSDSSASSSSSSKSSKTPPVRVPKRTIPDDHMAVSQTVKPKAMDALKLSGQKQQIKLTLKGSNSNASQSKRAIVPETIDNRKDRQPPASKKRVADSSDSGSDSDVPPSKKLAKLNQNKRGAPPSRREELLKQLRAVEDAIARKRSKNL